jgi:phosphonate transport system ATP-binding protein
MRASCAEALAAGRLKHDPATFELRGASVVYGGAPALLDADLLVRPGEALALVGPSGAGKTTLLGLLNATVRPSRGEVRVNGLDVASLSPTELRAVRAKIGFVHKDLALVPNVRVSQNVLAGRLGSRSFLGAVRTMLVPAREELERAAAILRRVGIGEKLYQRTDTLSGGQRQRVAIARALFQQPGALLADEPVSSVDPTRARDTVALLRDVCGEEGLTLLASLHDLEIAREYFPRLVGLRAGRIVFDRAPGEVDSESMRALYEIEERAPNGR